MAGARTVTERCASGWIESVIAVLSSASAMRAKSATVSDSPRSKRGDAGLRARAFSAASVEPASPRSAPRRPLRRWANAASTTANTC